MSGECRVGHSAPNAAPNAAPSAAAKLIARPGALGSCHAMPEGMIDKDESNFPLSYCSYKPSGFHMEVYPSAGNIDL